MNWQTSYPDTCRSGCSVYKHKVVKLAPRLFRMPTPDDAEDSIFKLLARGVSVYAPVTHESEARLIADKARKVNDLVGEMGQKGLVFNTPDGEPFRQTLIKAGFYTEWKAKYGPEAWGALEKAVGATLG